MTFLIFFGVQSSFPPLFFVVFLHILTLMYIECDKDIYSSDVIFFQGTTVAAATSASVLVIAIVAAGICIIVYRKRYIRIVYLQNVINTL